MRFGTQCADVASDMLDRVIEVFGVKRQCSVNPLVKIQHLPPVHSRFSSVGASGYGCAMILWLQEVTGTNLQRMASGRAPIGTDGNSVNLHHMTQTQNGAIAEITQTFHQQNSGVIHINPGQLPSGINRSQFNTWSKQYWQDRAANWGN
ncbi:HNH/ENDO VII family nuclease [Pararhizobium sp.]|uniref:HNH/ENDO VII family nuclease n=1 Tax=Pararhizobium sp. TaxID=1977563 RepID=UPI00271B36B2|nr:HNH/ENDO VII family nuclease [Pararhizobium sp.]MDO9417156.1 HNH/ENDO VII family nuclease [Pararhizobium sp.]